MKSDQFVVKVAGRCNLACRYCYMYELGDNSALAGPKRMAESTLGTLANRIVEHAKEEALDRITVALHGGEPLLLGRERFRKFCNQLRAELGSQLQISVQTNGTLITSDWLNEFLDADAVVGISIDGPREANDIWRIDHSGRGTYEKTVEGYWKLFGAARTHGLKFGGVISVLNPRQSPVKYYNWVKELQIDSLSLLLPDANHDNYDSYYPYLDEEMANFLIELFETWWSDSSNFKPSIRIFENIISRIFGGTSDSESIGTGDAPAIIIETDGSIQAHDVLRINKLGHSYTGNVRTDKISIINSDDLYRIVNPSKFRSATELHNGAQLCEKCQKCPAGAICAGGFISHRYSIQNGFNNPSVHCATLFDTITHIFLKASSMN